MQDITGLMSHDHRACDDLFAQAENASVNGDWLAAQTAYDAFSAALERHFCAEEEILFPRFEAVTGMTDGPTRMMRADHRDMREQLESMASALEQRDADEFAGECETLLIMMQQHNMKEENILYPMCDHRLEGEAQPLASALSRHLTEES